MKKYNCNNTLDYAHEASRMCKQIRPNCNECPLSQLEEPCDTLEGVTAEHIKRVQIWSDAHPEITLTDKQVEIFKALNLIGFRYIAQDSDGKVYAFTERPRKGSKTWLCGGSCFNYFNLKYLRAEVFDAVSPFVSWSDTEPLCIAEALEQAEVHP